MSHDSSQKPHDSPLRSPRGRRWLLLLVVCAAGFGLFGVVSWWFPRWAEKRIVAGAAQSHWDLEWDDSSWQWNRLSFERLAADSAGVRAEIAESEIHWSWPEVVGGSLGEAEFRGASIEVEVSRFFPPQPPARPAKPSTSGEAAEPSGPPPRPEPQTSESPETPVRRPSPEAWWSRLPFENLRLPEAELLFVGPDGSSWPTRLDLTYQGGDLRHDLWAELAGEGISANFVLSEEGSDRHWTLQADAQWAEPLEVLRRLIPADAALGPVTAAELWKAVHRWKTVAVEGIALGVGNNLEEAALLAEGEELSIRVPESEAVVKLREWVGAFRGNRARWEMNLGGEVAPWQVDGWEGPAFQINFQRDLDGSVLLETPRFVWGNPLLGVQGETVARMRGPWAALRGTSGRGMELQVAMESLRVMYFALEPFRVFAQVSPQAVSGRISPLRFFGFDPWSFAEAHFSQNTLADGSVAGNASGRWERKGDSSLIARATAEWTMGENEPNAFSIRSVRSDESPILQADGRWQNDGRDFALEALTTLDLARDRSWITDLPVMGPMDLQSGEVRTRLSTDERGRLRFETEVENVHFAGADDSWRWEAISGKLVGVLFPWPQGMGLMPWTAESLRLGRREASLEVKNLNARVRLQNWRSFFVRQASAEVLGGRMSIDRASFDPMDGEGTFLVNFENLSGAALHDFQPLLTDALARESSVSGVLRISRNVGGWRLESVFLTSHDGAWRCRYEESSEGRRQAVPVAGLLELIRAALTDSTSGDAETAAGD